LRSVVILLSLLAALALTVPWGTARAGDTAPGAQQDTTPPQVLSVEPNGTEVEVEHLQVVITFSEPMNTSVLDAAAVRVGEEALPTAASWGENGTVLTLTILEEHLDYSTNYTVTVNVTATDVEDNPLDGNGNGLPDGPADVVERAFRTEPPVPIPFQPAGINPFYIVLIVVVVLLAVYAAVRARGLRG